MKGYDVLYELYHGNLNPGDRGFRNDTFFAVAMDAFKEHEGWLREKLDGEAANASTNSYRAITASWIRCPMKISKPVFSWASC